MNEADKNKLIITTSWLFEAVNNQYRAVINDIRKSMMFSMYKLSTLFNKFNKNINLYFINFFNLILFWKDRDSLPEIS